MLDMDRGKDYKRAVQHEVTIIGADAHVTLGEETDEDILETIDAILAELGEPDRSS